MDPITAPPQMNASFIEKVGGDIESKIFPLPAPKADQILVKSIYAPVNPVFVGPHTF
jgi:hypothetical protein